MTYKEALKANRILGASYGVEFVNGNYVITHIPTGTFTHLLKDALKKK